MEISGYARVMAQVHIARDVKRPFFGKPHLTYHQCGVLLATCFQFGGILGAKYSANLDVFGRAFLGVESPSGTIRQLFTKVAEFLKNKVDDSMSVMDLVYAQFVAEVGYAGDVDSFLEDHGAEKMAPDTAEELACQYSLEGAALGAMYPHIVRRLWEMFVQQAESEAELSYEEAEQVEDGVFTIYCRTCCPDLYLILTRKSGQRTKRKCKNTSDAG